MLATTVKKVFVVRHGQSEWNGQKRISGQLNPALTAMGRLQAAYLAQALRDKQLTAIYASPLSRALETAKPTAEHKQLPVQTCDALKEIHLGILQGRYRDYRDPEARRLWDKWQAEKVADRVPGGESFVDLEARVMPCLETILGQNQNGTILLVTHRSVVRVILGKLMHWSREDYLPLEIHNQFLYEVAPGPEPIINTVRFDKDTENKKGRRYAGFKN
jgi:broad specificity phosphatase PhoE